MSKRTHEQVYDFEETFRHLTDRHYKKIPHASDMVYDGYYEIFRVEGDLMYYDESDYMEACYHQEFMDSFFRDCPTQEEMIQEYLEIEEEKKIPSLKEMILKRFREELVAAVELVGMKFDEKFEYLI